MSVQTLSSNGAFNNQGVLSANLNGTPTLVGFPTTSTSNSVGMYSHLGIAGSPNLETNFLNASGATTGGFNFWTSNATTAPDKILNLSTQGLTTNKIVKVALNNDEYSIRASDSLIRNYADGTNNIQNSFKIQLTNDNLQTRILSELGSTSPYTLHTDSTANNSRLSATDLTFNNVSLKSQVSNNTADISQNKIDISNNTANIVINTASINTINHILPQIVVPQLVFSSPAIYADSTIIPSTNTTYQNTFGVFGWYVKNTVAGTKFNYYFPPQPNMKVSDLKGIYYEMFNNCTSLGSYPYITIYTKPTGVNDYRPWYHSSYTVVPSVFQAGDTFVQCFGNLQGLSYNSANVWGNFVYSPLIASDVQNPKGDYQNDQQILFISLGSNSASAVNSLNCSLLKLGMISTFTNEFLFL